MSPVAAALDREARDFEARTRASRERHRRSRCVFPGGDTRAITHYEPYPVTIERAQGIELVDVDGNSYADFLLNYTALVGGHRHPAVMDVVSETLARMSAVAAPVPGQVELAEELVARLPAVETVRFTNSGTEATNLAVWAARAYTGRSAIVKAIGGYHGSVPELDRSIRPDFLPPGVSAPATRAVPFNDVGALQQAIRDAGDSLAAVLLEPVLGSGGIVPPVAGYLEAAQEAAHDAGALFVLDEVITFRLGPGGHQALAGLTPDITALGKSIGGGFPVGALGGRAGVMEVFSPRHPRGVSHSGTFNGNPVTVAAGRALLGLLDHDAYAKLDRLGALLAHGLTETIDRLDLGAQVTHVGSLVNVHFSVDPIRNYDDAQNVDRVAAAAFHLGLLNRGIFIAPRGMMAVSTVTEERDVEKAIAAAADVLAGIAS